MTFFSEGKEGEKRKLILRSIYETVDGLIVLNNMHPKCISKYNSNSDPILTSLVLRSIAVIGTCGFKSR